MKKKIISIALMVCLMACLAVTSFAATDLNATFPTWIYDTGDGNTLIGQIDYVSMTAEQKAFYMECMKAFSGQELNVSYQYLAVLCDTRLSFVRTVSSTSFKAIKRTVSPYKYAISLPSGVVTSTMTFSRGSDLLKKVSVYYPNAPYTSNGGVIAGEASVILAASSNRNFDSTFTAEAMNQFTPSFSGNALGFTDNNPDNEPDPDPPLPPVNPPKPPEIPQGDPTYVPYDTSIWHKFLQYVQGNIGSAVNIGLLIFAVIFGILIVIKVVKWFAKG